MEEGERQNVIKEYVVDVSAMNIIFVEVKALTIILVDPWFLLTLQHRPFQLVS